MAPANSRWSGSVRRVVITGLGAVTTIGIGKNAFWKGILESKSGINRITRFDASKFRCQIAGEIKDEDLVAFSDLDFASQIYDRSTGLAITGIRLAIEDAGLVGAEVTESGCYVGIALGGAHYAEVRYHEMEKNLESYNDPGLFFGNAPSGCSFYVNKEFGFQGPSHTLSTGCAAGTDCVGFAFRKIQMGKSNRMIAGGTEAPVNPISLAAFDVIRALSSSNGEPQKACRPFDKNRDGFVASEGSAFIVLEDYETARKRHAHIYVEILGFASTANSFHMTKPLPSGNQNARAITLALKDAGIPLEKIDYVSAHGSSTPLNDKIETSVIKRVFGDHARKMKISSTKSQVGHMLGAAGSIELISTCLGMCESVAPPTINLETSDSECDLDYVPNWPQEWCIDYAVSNACGFGGLNSVIVLGKI